MPVVNLEEIDLPEEPDSNPEEILLPEELESDPRESELPEKLPEQKPELPKVAVQNPEEIELGEEVETELPKVPDSSSEEIAELKEVSGVVSEDAEMVNFAKEPAVASNPVELYDEYDGVFAEDMISLEFIEIGGQRVML